jgi:alpha-L-rhamnosidase
MRRMSLMISAFLLLTVSRSPGTNSSGLLVTHLRCEYMNNPTGIDATQPRLSWILESTDSSLRGQRQTAYQVIVASSREKLSENQGDVWDSMKTFSDQTIQLPYPGTPLQSKCIYYWKARVWDEHDSPSSWSDDSFWSMGLLKKSEWAAKWISDPSAVTTPQSEADSVRGVNSGYRSAIAAKADTEKWVGVDLGAAELIDSVRLFPAYPYDWQPGGPAYDFPVRFKIEASNQSDFSDASVVVDRTDQDFPAPLMNRAAPVYRFSPTQARFVRLVVTRLYAENELFASFALAEMQVLSNGQNLAAGKQVIALDTLDGAGWSKANLVDGITTPIRSRAIIQPTGMLRKAFALNGEIRRATVYVTARGLYELRLNGNRVGDHVLAPEWTDYNKRIQYQTYDVTDLVKKGDNAIGAYLGAGWYSGHVGLLPVRRIYGTVPEFLMHLDVEFSDGRKQTIVTDESWKHARESPIVSSDIYDGETYDARKEQAGWDAPGFDDRSWLPVATTVDGSEELVWQKNEPIRVTGDLKPIAITQPSPGVYIFDSGQNHSGWIRIRTKGPAGTVITVRHGEALNPDGSMYLPNIRGAWQIDRYILRGTGEEEIFEPHFTIHGFRYAEISGLPELPGLDTVVARVTHSSSPEVSEFQTSSAFLDRLMSTISWTQRSNMIGIPTDCPQRDERLGWTGDELTFSQTAIFNMNMAGFFTKWMQDMRDDQSSDGRFPDVAPNPMNVSSLVNPVFRENLLDGSPAWADAGVVIPWRMYENYGDVQLLTAQFKSAQRWVEFILSRNPDLLWKNARGLDPGDWLNGDTLIEPGWPRTGAKIPHVVFATAYFAHTTELLSKIAAATGHAKEARRYAGLFTQIREAFNRAFVQPDGRIEGDTQSAYALALDFDLLPESLRPKAVGHLLEGLQRYNGHASTGIHGTRSLMLELSSTGHNDEAYRLINSHTLPSWGYMLDMGATTIWERWDGYVADHGFDNHTAMNSLNHVVLGSVGEWMWHNIIGLAPDDSNPGYKHFVIHPRPGGELTWAKGSFESVRGRISSEWKIENGVFSLDVTVPPNTLATVYLPARDSSRIQESGKGISNNNDVKFVRMENGSVVLEVGSGEYYFRDPM